jgi:hypothetical protein
MRSWSTVVRTAAVMTFAAALSAGSTSFWDTQVRAFVLGEAQDRGSDGRARNPGLSGWCETPVADRKAEAGCYTTAITSLGMPPRGPLFWHLDTYPDRAAAEAQRGARGTVVDGHGKHWLFTIAEES